MAPIPEFLSGQLPGPHHQVVSLDLHVLKSRRPWFSIGQSSSSWSQPPRPRPPFPPHPSPPPRASHPWSRPPGSTPTSPQSPDPRRKTRGADLRRGGAALASERRFPRAEGVYGKKRSMLVLFAMQPAVLLLSAPLLELSTHASQSSVTDPRTPPCESRSAAHAERGLEAWRWHRRGGASPHPSLPSLHHQPTTHPPVAPKLVCQDKRCIRGRSTCCQPSLNAQQGGGGN